MSRIVTLEAGTYSSYHTHEFSRKSDCCETQQQIWNKTEGWTRDNPFVSQSAVVLEHLSGQSTGVLTLLNHHHAIDDDVGDALRVLMWISVGRPVGDGLGVE